MNDDTLIEDMKDRILDVIAPEYHRLNSAGVKHYIGTIEVFLGAVATAFLLPYVKKLAELSAQATWDSLSRSGRKSKEDVSTDTTLLRRTRVLIERASAADEAEARKLGEQAVRRFLEEQAFPGPIRDQTVETIVLYIDEIRRSPGDKH